MIRQENLTLKDTLTFGRYKGKTIDWNRGFDVQYLIWAEREGIITFHPKTKGCILDDYSKYNRYYNRYYYDRGYDEDDAELDFCLGLSGGAQGW